MSKASSNLQRLVCAYLLVCFSVTIPCLYLPLVVVGIFPLYGLVALATRPDFLLGMVILTLLHVPIYGLVFFEMARAVSTKILRLPSLTSQLAVLVGMTGILLIPSFMPIWVVANREGKF